jgi:hypothetical protein
MCLKFTENEKGMGGGGSEDGGRKREGALDNPGTKPVKK